MVPSPSPNNSSTIAPLGKPRGAFGCTVLVWQNLAAPCGQRNNLEKGIALVVVGSPHNRNVYGLRIVERVRVVLHDPVLGIPSVRGFGND